MSHLAATFLGTTSLVKFDLNFPIIQTLDSLKTVQHLTLDAKGTTVVERPTRHWIIRPVIRLYNHCCNNSSKPTCDSQTYMVLLKALRNLREPNLGTFWADIKRRHIFCNLDKDQRNRVVEIIKKLGEIQANRLGAIQGMNEIDEEIKTYFQTSFLETPSEVVPSRSALFESFYLQVVRFGEDFRAPTILKALIEEETTLFTPFQDLQSKTRLVDFLLQNPLPKKMNLEECVKDPGVLALIQQKKNPPRQTEKKEKAPAPQPTPPVVVQKPPVAPQPTPPVTAQPTSPRPIASVAQLYSLRPKAKKDESDSSDEERRPTTHFQPDWQVQQEYERLKERREQKQPLPPKPREQAPTVPVAPVSVPLPDPVKEESLRRRPFNPAEAEEKEKGPTIPMFGIKVLPEDKRM